MNGNTSASNCPSSLKVYGFFCEMKFLTLLTAAVMNQKVEIVNFL